jgi:hypothetical protein
VSLFYVQIEIATEGAAVRNAYTLLDFGTWIDDSDDQAHPFMQMLPVTNIAAARSSFVQVRLGGNDTTTDSRWSLLAASQMQHSPISDEEKKKKYQEMIFSRWPYIFTGCFVFILLVTGCCIWRCCKRRRARQMNKKANHEDKFGDVFSKDVPGQKANALSSAKRQSYIPLEGSTTDLRAQYAHQPHNPFATPDPRTSAASAHSEWQDDRQSNYTPQNVSPGYMLHDGGPMQHGTYPPQRF